MVNSVAQLINTLKTSNRAKKEMVLVSHSNFKESILSALKKAKYIKSFNVIGKGPIKKIEIELSYNENGQPKIEGVNQVSKSSRRMYLGAKDIRPVRNGTGLTIITTPAGILTDREAKKQNVGGEPLFIIW